MQRVACLPVCALPVPADGYGSHRISEGLPRQWRSYYQRSFGWGLGCQFGAAIGAEVAHSHLRTVQRRGVWLGLSAYVTCASVHVRGGGTVGSPCAVVVAACRALQVEIAGRLVREQRIIAPPVAVQTGARLPLEETLIAALHPGAVRKMVAVVVASRERGLEAREDLVA